MNNFINQNEIVSAIKNCKKSGDRKSIDILLKKKWGEGYMIIQRLIDGLGFVRYDCMRVHNQRDPQGDEEPQGILVFLDEGNKVADTEKEYQEKRKAYKQRMIDDNSRNLHLDHRLVSSDSELRGTDLLSIAQSFFMTRNERKGKIFDAIVINNVSQVSVIKWLIKNGFDFL